MDLIKEGESISCPPPFDRTNYKDWNVWMCVFIRSFFMKGLESSIDRMVSSNQDR